MGRKKYKICSWVHDVAENESLTIFGNFSGSEDEGVKNLEFSEIGKESGSFENLMIKEKICGADAEEEESLSVRGAEDADEVSTIGPTNGSAHDATRNEGI